MRLTCPACSAPFHVRDDAAGASRCPNCDHEVVPGAPVWRPALEDPPSEPRSRVVTAVGFVHFIFAASNLCIGLGISAVGDQPGEGRVGLLMGAFLLGHAALWAGVGVGVLARFEPARILSMCLACLAVCLSLSSGRNVIGFAFHTVVAAFILLTLVGRREEFR